MGARLMVDFVGHNDSVVARVYDHGAADNVSDASAVLHAFVRAVKAQTEDTRFTDPSYLAAKFVTWRAIQYVNGQYGSGNPLDFLSVGIMPTGPEGLGPEEQRARIVCTSSPPAILVLHRDGDWEPADPDIPYHYEQSAEEQHARVRDAIKARFARLASS